MIFIKLWVDDVRPAPSGYIWVKSVKAAKTAIWQYEHNMIDDNILIDLDHDAGDYVSEGGDYIKLLDWLEAENIVDTGYSFHIHSMNVVGVQNMRTIIKKNEWREIREWVELLDIVKNVLFRELRGARVLQKLKS